MTIAEIARKSSRTKKALLGATRPTGISFNKRISFNKHFLEIIKLITFFRSFCNWIKLSAEFADSMDLGPLYKKENHKKRFTLLRNT